MATFIPNYSLKIKNRFQIETVLIIFYSKKVW